VSINATNWVWGITLGNATRKLVLMRYADHAHADGTVAWVGIEKVATYAECDKRTAQRHVAYLVENGYMREGDQRHVEHLPAKHRPIVYDLAMDEATRAEWEVLNAAGGNARRDAARAAGARGGAASAQVRRGDKMSPQEVESTPTESTGDKMSPQDRGDTTPPVGVTPEPPRGDTRVTQTTHESTTNEEPSTSAPLRDADTGSDAAQPIAEKNQRADVAALCDRLSEWIVKNGSKRPNTTTKAWRDEARLLLDVDGRDLTKALALIDWCQQDTFERTVILSMAKFRDRYDALRLKALAAWEAQQAQTKAATPRRGDIDWDRARAEAAEADKRLGLGDGA
jgi:hypothetical protein